MPAAPAFAPSRRASARTRAAPPSAAAQGEPPPAIVVGLDSVTGVQTARILAARGVPVIGVAGDPRHPCCRTRACRRVIAADTGGAALVDALAALARELGGPAVVVPCTDLAVLVLSRGRRRLPPSLLLALPDAEVVETLVDKARFAELARREGLPVPPTFVLRSPADVDAAARALRFPAVLKPAVKTAGWQRQVGAKALPVADAAELRAVYARCAPWAESLVVQEWIPGGDGDHFTCNACFGAGGEPLATFTSRKLRQWPPFGGEACLSVESRNDEVEAQTVRLFRAVGHRGLGYLEMKRDPRTGAHLIIEPNVGRPTGRSAGAEAAGVELLMTMYADLLGRPLPARRRQAYTGTRWIHWRRDLQAAARLWLRRELTVAGWLRSVRGPRTDALFSWRDPVPFWADLARVARRLVVGRRPGRDDAGE